MSAGRKWFGMKSKRRQGKANTNRRVFRSARIESLEPRQVLSATVPTLDMGFVLSEGVTLHSGSPLHIPLDGIDSDGLDLDFTVSSSNTSVVSASFTSANNRSMKIETNYGDMVLELFEDRVPRATEQIITLAEDGFYGGVIFHRVINGFMIQGGDPTGTGGGGSDLPDFDDQFHIDLQHNRGGLLSMAKSGDDTNNSQFFITEVPTRYLDYNHSIFGLLIEGEDVREEISDVDTGANDKPDVDVVMESVEIYYDNQNATLILKAEDGITSGEADITITMIDDDGTEYESSFHVTVEPDVTPDLPDSSIESLNSNPFLADIDPITTSVNTTTYYNLQSIDVDGDMEIQDGSGGSFTLPGRFYDQYLMQYWIDQYYLEPNDLTLTAHPDLDYAVNTETGMMTITPTNGLVGVHPVMVAVGPWVTVGEYDNPVYSLGLDTQLVPVVIQPEGLTAVSKLEMTIVQTSTTTDAYGEIDQLPENVDWMDEWESFSVEIWASTLNNTDGFGIHTAAFDLTYNTNYYTATEIEYGNAFSQNRTGTIDDTSGLINNIGGTTPMYTFSHIPNIASSDPDDIEKFGDDKPVLVARVHFQPNATGAGVPIHGENGYMMPVTDLGLSIQEAQVGWNVAPTTTVQVGSAPVVDVWPMMFDNDDNGEVALGDLAHFAQAYQNSVDPNDPNDPGRRMDYDRSGSVALGDLSFFASNYQSTSTSGNVTAYPAGFPDEWLPPAAPATSQTMATLEDEPAESLSDGDLCGTVADDTVTETQLAYAIAQSQQDSQSETRSTDTSAAIIDLLMQSEEF